jgi:hypothetical protein
MLNASAIKNLMNSKQMIIFMKVKNIDIPEFTLNILIFSPTEPYLFTKEGVVG